MTRAKRGPAKPESGTVRKTRSPSPRLSPEDALAALTNGFDPRAFLTSAGTGKTVVKQKAGATIFRQGQPCNALFYLEKGRVQLSVVSKQGKEAVIAMLGPGDFFGEGCLAGQPLHISSATAMAASTLMRIEKDTMVRVLHDQRALAEYFTAFLLSRNSRIEADLIDQLFNSSERRLARLLLFLSDFGKDGKMETVVPKVSQDLLAARIGTTRGRINFFMNKFRKLGMIEYNGELKVHSSLLRLVIHE